VTAARLVASVVAATMALAFWWALTEPLPFAPAVLYAVPALILFIAGITAGRVGALAAPIALVFSLLLGSIIATPLHQALNPSSRPVSTLGRIPIDPAALLVPLLVSTAIGGAGGVLGERMLPTRREWPGR